ncbi:MAG TPA: squalene/phytoene synthase family protein, partial [Ktedonobacterales bacterium]|nr:squalene/phytoene synthase family protein [Ktedonobacterales bacterium]
ALAPAPDAAVGAVALAAAYEHCRLLTCRIARTFYFGSRFLPLEKRRAAWALYAFCLGDVVGAEAARPFP